VRYVEGEIAFMGTADKEVAGTKCSVALAISDTTHLDGHWSSNCPMLSLGATETRRQICDGFLRVESSTCASDRERMAFFG
jgi:hypothetical protein